MRGLATGAAALPLLLVAQTAAAFQIRSGASDGCHEQAAFEAFMASTCPVSSCDGTVPAPWAQPGLPFDGTTLALAEYAWPLLDDRVLYRDEMKVAWYSFMSGVRYNDLKGHGLSEVAALREVHSTPAFQREHCLREPGDDGTLGDAKALARCRGFVEEQLALAEAAFRASDERRLARVPVYVEHYGAIDLDLNAGFFHLGRAAHALQDSYAHGLRSAYLRKIVHMANWIECTGELDHDEARDGMCHSATTDTCTGDTEPLLDAAAMATLSLLAAFAERLTSETIEAQRALLDEVFSLEPGCTMANDYCGTPWLAVARRELSPLGHVKLLDRCAMVPPGRRGDRGSGGAWVLALAAVGAWAERRLRRRP
jgi:hypothetical protein